MSPHEEQSSSGLEAARALSLGAVLGEAGLPDGSLTVEESESPVYLVGWLLGSIAFPPFDVRDLVQNVANGQPVEAVLDLAGIVPFYGDIAKGAGKVAKYADEFADSAKIAMKIFARAGLEKVPDEVSGPVLRAAFNDEYARLINQGLLPSDVSRLLKNVDEGENLADVRRVASLGDEVLYLATERWKHIDGRHMSGSIYSDGIRTTFFPTGDVIKHIEKGRPRFRLPNKMSRFDVENLISQAIEEGTITGTKFNGRVRVHRFDVERFGIDEMEVWVDIGKTDYPGRIATAFPKSGSSVYRWVEGEDAWKIAE